jgi:hypothetical protein
LFHELGDQKMGFPVLQKSWWLHAYIKSCSDFGKVGDKKSRILPIKPSITTTWSPRNQKKMIKNNSCMKDTLLIPKIKLARPGSAGKISKSEKQGACWEERKNWAASDACCSTAAASLSASDGALDSPLLALSAGVIKVGEDCSLEAAAGGKVQVTETIESSLRGRLTLDACCSAAAAS